MEQFDARVNSLIKTVILWLFIAIITIDVFIFFSIFRLATLDKVINLVNDLTIMGISFYLFSSNRRYYLIVLILLPCIYYLIRFNIHIFREPIFWIVFFKSLMLGFVINLFEVTVFLKYVFLKRIIYVVPFLIIIFLSLFYILTDLSPPSWDAARHGANAFKVFDILFSDEGFIDAWMFYDFYPSLGYILTIPFQLLFGRNNDALVLSILFLWFPLAYYYSLKVFKEIFGVNDGRESILNFIFHSNVMLLSLLKQYMLDYQLLALFIVQFYFLITSDEFTKWKNVIIGGVLCGVGFMIKQSYLVYALMLFSSYFLFTHGLKVLKWNIVRWNDFYLKAGITCFLIGLFAVPWFSGWSFLFNWEMKGAGSYEASGKAEGDPYPFSIDSFTWYFDAFIYYFTWPILVLLVLGLFRMIRGDFKWVTLINLTGLVGVWLIFTMLWNKDFRFLLPSILFFIPGFVGLLQFNRTFSKVALTVSLMLSLAVNFIQAFPKLHDSPNARFFSPYVKKHEGILAVNAPLSFSVATKFLIEEGVSNLELENLNESMEYNNFSRQFYQRQLHLPAVPFTLTTDSVKFKEEVFSWDKNTIYRRCSISDSSNYVLLRDPLYPFYVFLKIHMQNNSITIEKKGEYGRVKGKIKYLVNKKDTLDDEPKIVMPHEKGKKVELKVIVLHSDERWPLIFRQHFTGEISLSENLSLKYFEMTPLRSDSKQNAIIIE